MMIVIFCLAAAVLYLLFRLFSLYCSMDQAQKELEEISGELFENREVKLAVPDKKLEKFLETINQNLQAIRLERLSCQDEERRLKEQIENISHDLRTPLTAVIGYLKMIDTEQLNEEDRRFLEIAIRKSHTLQELTGQFYELSRVTSYDFTLEREIVDAARILKETCLENYDLLEKAGLTVTLPPLEQPVMVWGNQESLKRVFGNLLQNCIRYARTRLHVGVELDAAEGTVRFLFSNDIRPEQEISDADRLFDRFYMQEESRSHTGTGLGLTISRTLAEHMGGTIHAEYSGTAERRFLTFVIQMAAQN